MYIRRYIIPPTLVIVSIVLLNGLKLENCLGKLMVIVKK